MATDTYSPFTPASVREALTGIKTHMPALVRGLWLTLTMAIIGTAGRLVVPITIQQVVKLITAPILDAPTVFQVLIIAACCSALASSIQVIAIRRLGIAAERGLAQARITGVDLMHRLSIDQLTLAPRGQLISRLTTDIDDMASYLSSGMILLFLSLLQIVVVAVMMVIWEWKLALIVAVCSAVFVVVAVHIQRQIAPAFAKARDNAGTMQAVLAETIMGAEVIQAFDIAERTENRVVSAIDETRKAETKGGKLSSLYSGITLWFQTIITVITIVASVFLVANGQMDVGVALAFPFLVTMFAEPMIWFGESLSEAQMTMASWRRVCGMLNTTPAITDPAETGMVEALPDGPLPIALYDVSLTYPNGVRPALIVDELHIPAGQQLAVVGETGSGKSTLSKLITRLIVPTEGTVAIGGVNLELIGEADLRANVLMVPQDDVLMGSSLRQNLQLAQPGADDKTLLAAIDDLGLIDWLNQLPAGLATELGERGANLSAGQRQLVGLIRAHLASPRVLVLDEATSALDPATERLVRQAMAALVAGRTTVTIAHRLTTAAEADRILVIHDGSIVEDGPHEQLANQDGGRYAALWKAWEQGTQA